MRWIDGLLAIHQGSRFAALVHPFADQGSKGAPAVCWSTPESALIPFHNGLDDARSVRAFPPVATPDRRFVLFSSPRGAFAVDLWTLPGWGVGAAARVLTLCDVQRSTGVNGERSPGSSHDAAIAGTLATPPVPLTARWNSSSEQDACLVGLLLHAPSEGSEYQWIVLDLANQAGLVQIHQCPLPGLRGAPVQILVSPDQLLTFATSKGHWWWRWKDASGADAGEFLAARPRLDGSPPLALDRQIVDSRLFTKTLQHAISPQTDVDETNRAVELCYATHGLPEYLLIHPEQRACDYPTLSQGGRQLVPIGVDENTVWMLGGSPGGRGAELLRRSVGGGWPRDPWAEVYGDLRAVIGVQLNFPGLVLVCKESDEDGVFTVRVANLNSSGRDAVADFKGLRLIADPLVVDQYLFTLEDVADGAQLKRRRLPGAAMN